MAVEVGSNQITGITTAVNNTDAAYKDYVASVNNANPIASPINQSNKFLYTDGSTTSWNSIGAYVEYTTAGSYTFDVPVNAVEIMIEVTGGGGGGGGGGSGLSGSTGVGAGGGGGGSGATGMWIIPKGHITSSTISVTVGSSGSAGTGSAGNVAAGTNGGAGGASSVTWTGPNGSYTLSANGGAGGGR